MVPKKFSICLEINKLGTQHIGDGGNGNQRKLEVSVYGNILPGEPITLTAIIRLEASRLHGDFSTQFALDFRSRPDR